MTTTVTDEQLATIRAVLTSPDLELIAGVGDATVPGRGRAGTISAINLVELPIGE
jgi:hypothetical protein